MNIKHGSSWKFFSTESLGIPHWLTFSIVLMIPMCCLASSLHSCYCTTRGTIHVEPAKPIRGCRLPQKVFVRITEAQSRQVVPRNRANGESVLDPKLENYLRESWCFVRHPSFSPNSSERSKVTKSMKNEKKSWERGHPQAYPDSQNSCGMKSQPAISLLLTTHFLSWGCLYSFSRSPKTRGK